MANTSASNRHNARNKQKSWIFSTLCDNQCLSFVEILLGKALNTIFLENYPYSSSSHTETRRAKSLLRDMLDGNAGGNPIQNSPSETSQANLLEPTIATTSTDQVNDADAPVAVDAVLTTDIDRDLAILPSFLLSNDIDIDGDIFRISSGSYVMNEIVLLNSQGDIVFK
jgi:hypothetical protein